MTMTPGGRHARLTASTASVLLLLGINQLGQGAVAARALATEVPFAPQKDGTVFLAGGTEQFAAGSGRTVAPAPAPDRRSGRELRHSRRPR